MGKDYRLQLLKARTLLRNGKVIEAYDILGERLKFLEG